MATQGKYSYTVPRDEQLWGLLSRRPYHAVSALISSHCSQSFQKPFGENPARRPGRTITATHVRWVHHVCSVSRCASANASVTTLVVDQCIFSCVADTSADKSVALGPGDL